MSTELQKRADKWVQLQLENSISAGHKGLYLTSEGEDFEVHFDTGDSLESQGWSPKELQDEVFPALQRVIVANKVGGEDLDFIAGQLVIETRDGATATHAVAEENGKHQFAAFKFFPISLH